MRIEYLNAVTGRSGAADLPPGLNPVRVGHHPKNHLALDDPAVGAEAVAIDRDVTTDEGWRVWNRSGRPVRIDGTAVAERNRYVRPADRRATVECWPFVLTLLFAPEEWARDESAGRLDRACADAVRAVHKALIDLHPRDPEDRGEWLRDEYVHRLEQEIIDLAAARPGFTADNLHTSELAAHMAGVAVRSAVIRAVAADGGAVREPDWARYRLLVPELEAELTRLVAAVDAELGLGRLKTMTERVAAVDAGFGRVWAGLAAAAAPRVLRYLAVRRVVEEVKDVWYGFGPLEDLLDDPSVTDIMVVSADDIFVDRGGRIERSGRRFLTDPLITIQRVMGQANRAINTAAPYADARLPDGSRANAIIPPLALRGPCLTVRRFPPSPLTMHRLVHEFGMLSPAGRDFLRAVVAGRRNVIVSGGTGAGKTTLLNALSEFIRDDERVVTVEDTAELRLNKSHVVTLQGRPKNGEGAGEVSIRDLVRNALRMRPDRIVVGECRGGEALDMLQAMNTGHDGSMTTVHANDPAAAVERLAVLVQMAASSQLPVSAIRQQIVSAVDVIVQLEEVRRDGRKVRIVSHICEVVGYDPTDDAVRLVPLFRAGPGGLAPTGHLPTFVTALVAAGLITDPVSLVRVSTEPGGTHV